MADDSLSDEDKDLFRKLMQDVTPLKSKKIRAKAIKKEPPVTPKKRPPREINPTLQNYLSDYISEPVLSNTLLSYSQPGMPNKRLNALKNGKIPTEGFLDLHGLKADAARDALYTFIKTQSQEHKRCLLIVHGKGGQQGSPPVIKNLVNRWLPQMNEVLAFHSAQAKDGGLGAIYVLLRGLQF
jgi:DNA-nicking Smr family endonuclease